MSRRKNFGRPLSDNIFVKYPIPSAVAGLHVDPLETPATALGGTRYLGTGSNDGTGRTLPTLLYHQLARLHSQGRGELTDGRGVCGAMAILDSSDGVVRDPTPLSQFPHGQRVALT